MINDEAFDDQQPDEEVTAATMRRLAFEKIDDDYYLGGAVGDEVFDSDDEVSSDDEVKTHLRKLAGIEKEVTKDAFGRRRRRSDFEDEMDEELDKGITAYASEHLGATPKIVEIEDGGSTAVVPKKKKENEEGGNAEYEEDCRKADAEWRRETEEIEMKMAALELLPYDVDLTDSEVDPEMPAAVLKDKTGQAIKLVYSCQNGIEFDIEARKQRQRERRQRIAASRLPEKKRREKMIRTVVETYVSNEVVPSDRPIKKKFDEGAKTSQPLSSILKKTATPKKMRFEEKEEKMETDEPAEEAEETNPIKRAAMDRLKEIEKNDELLYDDQEDEDNEKWVKEHRKIARGEDVAAGEADGVLSCPGCMIELTRDCQRHEIYKTQYRAMFVSNCQLDDQKMAIEKTGKERRRERQKAKKSGKTDGPVLPEDSDMYTPVKCGGCGTLVAMMDSDEVYHFFNVLSGYS